MHLRAGSSWHNEYNMIFTRSNGMFVRFKTLYVHFKAIVKQMGRPEVRFHDVRHSCATLLLAHGVPLKQIQEWLGHSDFSTTANIYAHLDAASKQKSAETMEEFLKLV